MKRTAAYIGAATLGLAMAIPCAAYAQEIPPPEPQNPGDIAAPQQDAPDRSIGGRVRSNLEERANNIRRNREYRNSLVQGRAPGTQPNNDDATTSTDQDFPDQVASTTANAPRAHRNPTVRYVRSLSVTFDNLTEIRNRLSTGIDAARKNGSDVSDAQTALANVDTKLAQAKIALQALTDDASTTAPMSASSTIATSTQTLGDATKSALKEVRDALVIAIQAFTKVLGQ